MSGLTNWAYKRVYDGVNYRLRTLGGGRWASLCRPTSISLLLTELCNARCVHCDIWKNRGKEDSPTVDQWKTVVMSHNLADGPKLAHYAADGGMEVFYQAIEQNYNTEEDARWFEHSDNWPADTGKAVAAVEQLIALKRQGLPIANSYNQLEAM